MRPLVAVTGVTGYVGGRLVPELLDAGYRVRAIARNPTRLRGRPWYDQVDVVAADAADPDQIAAALEAVDIAYYLIHSLGTGRRFEARDRRSALTFGRAAREAGVGRIVYLGGLFPEGEDPPRTWSPARRSVRSCSPAGCRPPCCGRLSSSDRARRPSR